MSRSVEELLRQGLNRATADAEVPATLLRRARHHNRRRREAVAGALAAGGAAIAAAATFAATAAPGVSANARHGQTINYVTTRAERALAQLDPSQAIEINTLTARGGDFGFSMQSTAANAATTQPVANPLSGVHASSEVDWSYDGVFLQHGYSAAGKLVYNLAVGPQGEFGAAYPARIRWHNPLTGGSGGGNPPLSCDNAGFSFPSWKQGVSKALSCHLFTLARDQQVNGVDTIKLIRKPVTTEGETIRETLWVDPKTYLPLRISTAFTGAHGRTATMTDNFRWLSPTKANLASLHAAEQRSVIPASFRALPSTDLPLPGFDGPGSPG
jgi:hypothetical protein